MAVDPINSSNSTNFVDPSTTGFSGLTADSFLKLLITELQNQDPLEPMGNEEMLNQISMMRNLQSSIDLTSSLKSLTANQELATAATFIGRGVTGYDLNDQLVNGVADRVYMSEGQVLVGVGANQVPLSKIVSVNLFFNGGED